MKIREYESKRAQEIIKNRSSNIRSDVSVRLYFDDELQIVYKHSVPYGIRDGHGFLLFFPKINKYPNQEERYRREIEKQFKLADYLFKVIIEA